eukprot:SAG31_NODE_35594_length_321_cov_1.279279_1_plen_93_part_10
MLAAVAEPAGMVSVAEPEDPAEELDPAVRHTYRRNLEFCMTRSHRGCTGSHDSDCRSTLLPQGEGEGEGWRVHLGIDRRDPHTQGTAVFAWRM